MSRVRVSSCHCLHSSFKIFSVEFPSMASDSPSAGLNFCTTVLGMDLTNGSQCQQIQASISQMIERRKSAAANSSYTAPPITTTPNYSIQDFKNGTDSLSDAEGATFSIINERALLEKMGDSLSNKNGAALRGWTLKLQEIFRYYKQTENAMLEALRALRQ
jgi:hypothetical protein